MFCVRYKSKDEINCFTRNKSYKIIKMFHMKQKGERNEMYKF